MTVPAFVQPNIEAYGGDSRASALADALEMQAVTGQSMAEGQLVDYVADAGWGRRSASKFNDVGEEGDEEGPTAKDHAVKAHDCIRERSSLLGELYPFVLEDGMVSRRSADPCAYDVLLSLSAAHAYDVEIGCNPRDYLESLVVRALETVGLRTTSISQWKASKRKFPEVLTLACKSVGLVVSPLASVRRKRAFDGGVDVLAHLPLPPLRQSAWLGICQVTCASSDSWEAKFGEASPNKFRKLLRSEAPPHRLLAVPYHVEDKHLRSLEEHHAGHLLDRLNLCEGLARVVNDEDLRIARALDAIEVDAPRGVRRRPRAS